MSERLPTDWTCEPRISNCVTVLLNCTDT